MYAPQFSTHSPWALVSWLFSLLTLETLDSVAMFAGGLAAALMEEAATWLVHGGGGALAFVLAADTCFLLSRTFVHTTLTFSKTLLIEFHESARRISGLGTSSGQPSLILGLRLTRAFLRLTFGTPLPYDDFRQIL